MQTIVFPFYTTREAKVIPYNRAEGRIEPLSFEAPSDLKSESQTIVNHPRAMKLF
jgi:hypothetical protein